MERTSDRLALLSRLICRRLNPTRICDGYNPPEAPGRHELQSLQLTPSLLSRLSVNPWRGKYSSFPLPQINPRNPAVLPTKGRIAIVTDAGQDAVDAAASARRVVAG